MKSIEMKTEGYTYRYDFEPVPSNEETFNPDIVVPVEPLSDAGQCLDICLDMLRSISRQREGQEGSARLEQGRLLIYRSLHMALCPFIANL